MTDSELTTGQTSNHYPAQWRISQNFDPNDHLMNLKGRDYMNVQNRLLWFIRDQREFTIAGLAKVPYAISTELVEIDREAGWAHFKTYVRDVLGNEATMYGSEAARDFPDYAEKASTKSMGRALLALGYGTAFAPEMDEGDRVVDSPVDRRRGTSRTIAPIHSAPPAASTPAPVQAASVSPAPATPTALASAPAGTAGEPSASEQQMVSIRKLCNALAKPEPAHDLTYSQARQLITQLSGEYQRSRRAS